jgi:hypothetical protein
MTIYNLLFIDTEKHISRSAQIECLTDEWAIGAAALQAGDCRAVQIWDGDRPVALIANPRNPKRLGSMPAPCATGPRNSIGWSRRTAPHRELDRCTAAWRATSAPRRNSG